jgi:hypothetical protein
MLSRSSVVPYCSWSLSHGFWQCQNSWPKQHHIIFAPDRWWHQLKRLSSVIFRSIGWGQNNVAIILWDYSFEPVSVPIWSACQRLMADHISEVGQHQIVYTRARNIKTYRLISVVNYIGTIIDCHDIAFWGIWKQWWKYSGQKNCIMAYNSSCLDWISNLLVSSNGELDTLSYRIFYLTLTLSQLEISTSQEKTNLHIRLAFQRNRGGGALLYSQEAQSPRYWYPTFISISIQCTCFIQGVQIAPAFRWRENRTLRWSAVTAALARWSRRSPQRHNLGMSFYVIQKALCPLQNCILRVCAFYTTFCVLKSSIYVGFRTLWTLTKSRKSDTFAQTAWSHEERWTEQLS